MNDTNMLVSLYSLLASCTNWYRFYGQLCLRGNYVGQLDRMTEDSNGIISVLEDAHRMIILDNAGRKVCTFFIGYIPCLYFEDIDVIRSVFRRVAEPDTSREKPLRIFSELTGGDNIFMIKSGPEWRQMRRLIKKFVYDLEARKKMLVQMKQISVEYLDAAVEKSVSDFNIGQFFLQFTMDTVSQLIMGIDSGYIPRCATVISDTITEVLSAAQNPKYIFGGDDEISELRDRLISMFKDTILIPNEASIRTRDSLLREYLKMDNENLFGKNTLSNGFASLLAGHETTAMTFMFAVKLLTKHRKIESELRHLIAENLPDNYDVEFLSDMSNPVSLYIESIILETLRLFPPVSVIPRNATRDFNIKDIIDVSRDDFIFISPWLIHNSEKYFKNCSTFDPLRWHGEDGNIKMNRAFIPFGIGDRNCIGQLFAKLELKIFLIEIYRRHSFNIINNDDFEVSFIGTTRPRNPVIGRLVRILPEKNNEDNLTI